MTDVRFYDREDRPWPNPRLKNAAIVGHTTSTACRIWVRVRVPGSYTLVVGTSPLPTGDPGEASARATWQQEASFAYDDDLTHVFDVDGLEPGARHYYAVFAGDGRAVPCVVGRDRAHSFRTAAEDPDRVTFGLYSCHMPYDKRGNLVNLDMWDRFREELEDSEADFVVGGGDQVYVDGTKKLDIWRFLRKIKDDLPSNPKARREAMISWYRDIYRGYWGPLPLRRVLRSFPTYMIWDDHEIVDGWGSYTQKELSDQLDSIWEWENQGKNLALARQMFRAAKTVYREYQHAHNPPTPKRQFDYAFDWGPCAFYALDVRGQRDFARTTNDRILGEAQMKRLLSWLRSKRAQRAEVLFIVSPVPVVHASSFFVNTFDLSLFGINDDLRDEWEHESNWVERDRMLDEVFRVSDRSNKRVVFLSGDVHVGGAFRLSRAAHPGARVYQLTSSAITWSLVPGKLLKLAVRESGQLGAPKRTAARRRTSFSLVHLFDRNNFGLVRTRRRPEGGVDVAWDLFGSSGEEGSILKLARVWLDD